MNLSGYDAWLTRQPEPHEFTYKTAECHKDVDWVPSARVADLVSDTVSLARSVLARFDASFATPDELFAWRERFEALIRSIEGIGNDAVEQTHQQEHECPFEGEVDAQAMNGIIFWQCPLCLTEHEEDYPEPEEDEGRDR